MAKEPLTEAQRARRRAIRLKAKAAAEAEGKVWQKLPQEERRPFLQAARQATRQERQKARQGRQARKAAE